MRTKVAWAKPERAGGDTNSKSTCEVQALRTVNARYGRCSPTYHFGEGCVKPSKERRGNAKFEEAIAYLRQHGVGFVVSPRSIGIEVRFSLTHLTLELRYTPPLVFCASLPCASLCSFWQYAF